MCLPSLGEHMDSPLHVTIPHEFPESHLFYRQSRWALGFFILIPLSIYALARGITWRIQEKQAGLRE